MKTNKNNLMKKIMILITCFSFVNLLYSQTSKFDLSGNWKFRKKGDNIWLKATVPGTVHTDLLANKEIKDPFYRTNEKDQQWIETTDWEYQTTFFADDELLKKEKIEIVFEGLDTYADVYLNDRKIISADNMFLLWKSEVKNILKKGENKIRIIFFSPINKVMPQYNSLPYKVPVSNNDQAEKRVSVFSRKAGYHFGWDWGPRFVTSGIWRPVYLQSWNSIQIEDLFIKQLSITEKEANLEAQLKVNSTSEGTKVLEIFLNDKPTPVISRKVFVLDGENNLSVRFNLKDLKLWYPVGMGEQILHRFKGVISENGVALDSKEVKRGLRNIEVITESNEKGKSFYFKVNGKPLFMKGANYIPQDNFLPRVTRERYEHIINTCVSSNMNMLRVWGGGIYENDIFYELCDEKGILVWQDFMFACAMYPPLQDLRMNIQKEALHNVNRLRNYACIALWCGNNEIVSFMDGNYWNMQQGRFKTKEDSFSIINTYQEIFHSILPAAVKANDDEKFYWSTSPAGENYSMKTSKNNGFGDMHYWGVWWGKEPFENYNTTIGPFMSEYGFQSFPEFETVKTYTIPADYDINSEVMNAHQRSSIGNGTITHYMRDIYKVPKKFENFLYVGQILQGEGIKIALEAHRRAKPYCMGSLFWQIDDCWPVASWSSMDYYGRWKAQQYMVKRAFTDYLVSAIKENDEIKIFAISDKYQQTNATLNISLIDFNGKELKKEVLEIIIPENSSMEAFSFLEKEWVTNDVAKNVVLHLNLSVNGKVVSENNFFFERPKDLNLPQTKVTIKQISETSIELSANKFAKNVWINLPNSINAFSDNYFDILPGEKKVIEVKTKDLKSDLNKLQVKSLIDAYK